MWSPLAKFQDSLWPDSTLLVPLYLYSQTELVVILNCPVKKPSPFPYLVFIGITPSMWNACLLLDLQFISAHLQRRWACWNLLDWPSLLIVTDLEPEPRLRPCPALPCPLFSIPAQIHWMMAVTPSWLFLSSSSAMVFWLITEDLHHHTSWTIKTLWDS